MSSFAPAQRTSLRPWRLIPPSYWAGALLLLAAGCVSPSRPPALSQRADSRAAISVGLNSVDPQMYGGWLGFLPDCEVDAEVFALMAQDSGITNVQTLKTRQASRAGVVQALHRASTSLSTNGLLFLAHSSHGGQVQDRDGDEADGLDETICLYDGQLTDDQFMAFLVAQVRPCRIFLISDSCHSEGNFRAAPLVLRPAKGAAWSAWKGSLLQFAGCREARTSASTGSGGRWTTALVDAWAPGQTYREWFDKAARLMPASQRPVMVEYGQPFADMEAFQ